MIPQTILTFFRTLVRNRSLAAINILGLALGFSSCMLITLFLFDELSYDSYHTNLDRIFRVTTKITSEGSVDNTALGAAPLPDLFLQSYPEVEASVRLDRKGTGTVVRTSSEIFREDNAYSADASLFKIF